MAAGDAGFCNADNFEAVPTSAVERTGIASTFSFEVRRSGNIVAPANIGWELLAGSATSPADFTGPLSGSLAFGPNESSAILSIPLVSDNIPEPNEQFVCWLRPAPSDAVVAPWSVVQTFDPPVGGASTWAVGDRLLAGGVRLNGSLAVWKRPPTAVDAWQPVEGPVNSAGGPMVTDGLRLAHTDGTQLYIYELDDSAGTWAGPAVFPVPNGGAPHIIKISLSLSGDRLAMGVTGQNPGPIGAVELYSRANGVWSHETTIHPQDHPDTAGITQFGWSVSLAGGSLLTRGPGYSTNVIFERSPEGVWTPVKTFIDVISGGFDGQSVLVARSAGGIELRRRNAGGEGNWGVSAEAVVNGVVSRVWQDQGDFPAIIQRGGGESIVLFREGAPGQLIEVHTLAEWSYPEVPSIFPGPGGFLTQLFIQPDQPPAEWHQRGAVPLTIIDDDGVEVRVAGGMVREDVMPAVLGFELQLNRVVDVPVAVAVETGSDTAISGEDFEPMNASLTIPAGHWGIRVDVPLLADSDAEPAERLSLRARLTELNGPEASGYFTIEDDDAPRFTHVQSTVVEGDSDHVIALPLTLSAPRPAETAASMTFTGSAQRPADYQAVPGTVRFPPNTLSVPIDITVAGEFVTEDQENIVVQVNRGVSAPMPEIPWYFARETSSAWPELNGPRVISANRDFIYVHERNVARLLTLREDGGVTVTPLTGLPTQASSRGIGATCRDVIAQLFSTDGNNDDALAIWMLEGGQWSPAYFPFPEGTYDWITSITVQSDFVVIQSYNRLITLLRHAGGHNKWGVASNYEIPVPASSPGLASGPDWLALGLPFAEHTDGTVFAGAVHIFQRSLNSRDPWVPETVLRPESPEPSQKFGMRMFASGRFLALHNEPSQSVTSRATAVYERPVSAAGAWARTLTLRGHNTVQPVDDSLFVLAQATETTPEVVQYYSRNAGNPTWTAFNVLEPGKRGVPSVGSTLGYYQFLLGDRVVTLDTPVATQIVARSYVQAPSVLLIDDDDPHPLISIRDVTVSESDSTAIVPIEFTGGGSPAFTFTISTAAGSALAGRDFTPPPGNVSSLRVQVPVLNDDLLEPPENFSVTLLSSSSGKIVRRMATVTIMDDDADPARSTVLLAAGAPVRTFAPASAASFPQGWNLPGYYDAQWPSGAGPVGYDRDTPSANTYHALIGFNVQTAMYSRTSSLLSRSIFPLEAPFTDGWLMLRVRYDDGFAAWLNGQPLGASPGVVLPLAWNSTAVVPGTTDLASTSLQFPVSSAIFGTSNVLAIHGLNASTTSSDFLILRELIHTRPYRSSYLDWIGTWQSQLTAENYGPAGDVDRDGVANLVEWAAGTNAGSGPIPEVLAISRRNGQVILEVTVADPLPADVTCILQSSASLNGNWSNEAALSGATWIGSLLPIAGDAVAAGRKRWTFHLSENTGTDYLRLQAVLRD